MVDSVTALGGASGSTSQTSGLGSLDSDVFLQLMVAQLRYQNPMEPTDATAMMEQTAQFTTVETLQAIAETQRQIINMSQLNTAMDMVGKQVEAIDSFGAPTEGVVQGIKFTIDGVVLELEHTNVALTDVLSVNVVEGGGGPVDAPVVDTAEAPTVETGSAVVTDPGTDGGGDAAVSDSGPGPAGPQPIQEPFVGDGPAEDGGTA